MKASTNLRLMTLRTKKRLSDDPWSLRIAGLLLLGVFAIYATVIYGAITGPEHSVVYAKIPVMQGSKDDLVKDQGDIVIADLEPSSPTIVLTAESFFFGELAAFTKDFSDVRNKFYVRHDDGAPQLGYLIETMRRWRSQKNSMVASPEPVIFMPTAEIPLPIIIQIIDGLGGSELFSHVVLAAGLL